LIFDNGWFRIERVGANGVKRSHYFFNDKPIHSFKTGLFKEDPDFTKRYSFDTNKCKKCLNILQAYSTIGLQNRCK